MMRDDASPTDVAAITELFHQYAATLNAGDINGWSDLWSDDGVQMPIVGDWAYTRASYTATFTPKDGGPAAFVDGKALTLFRRSSNGTWKIYCDCFNSNVPTAAT